MAQSALFPAAAGQWSVAKREASQAHPPSWSFRPNRRTDRILPPLWATTRMSVLIGLCLPPHDFSDVAWEMCSGASPGYLPQPARGTHLVPYPDCAEPGRLPLAGNVVTSARTRQRSPELGSPLPNRPVDPTRCAGYTSAPISTLPRLPIVAAVSFRFPICLAEPRQGDKI